MAAKLRYRGAMNDNAPIASGLDDIRHCLAFLTRLPVPLPAEAAQPGALARAAWAFPLAGAVVGGVAGLALLAAEALSLDSMVGSFVAVAAAVLLTGGLHEDGLADVADGFGGGHDRAGKLAIMRDSRIGSYGVLALVLSVGLRVSLLASLATSGGAALALMAAGALSRAAMVPVMATLLPARTDGLGVGAGRPKWVTAGAAVMLGVILAGLALGPWEAGAWEDIVLAAWTFLAAMIAAVVAAVGVAVLARRQIGGLTGDVLGTVQQAAEIAVLVVAAAAS